MRRWIYLLLILALCLSLCACGGGATTTETPAETPAEAVTEAPTEEPAPTISPEELARREAYHEKMAAGLADKVDAILSNAERKQFEQNVKVVEIVKYQISVDKAGKYDEGTFCDMHLEAGWVAEEPEDVRFVVECTYGVSEKGSYIITNGKAYQHFVSVEITDLADGAQCGKNVFHGSEPPETVSEPGDHYGTEVDESEIRVWIASVIEEAMAESAAEAVEEIKYWVDVLGAPSRSDVLRWVKENGEFTDAMIDYALNHCGVDWKEMALQRAREELADQPGDYHGYFSYNWTVKYLTDVCDFTLEEAVYAADNCGGDWKELCYLQVKEYLEDEHTYNDGRAWLIENLKNYGLFADEDIAYALDKCGVK